MVKGPRRNKDFLDVSNEDFSKNRTISVEGDEITPSSKYYSTLTDLFQISTFSEIALKSIQRNY